MEKIIIYSNGAEILIAGNANNVDLLCEYVELITNNPFTKKNFSCYVKNAEHSIYAISIHNGRFYFRKRYCTYRIAKRRYKKISTYNFQLAMEMLDRLVKTATK